MSELEETATAPGGQPTGKPGSLQPGATFDHYVIERELGSGGMGVVFAAMDLDLQRRVALKLLRDGLPEQSQQRLLREARAMAKLSHPNVVTVYEVGRADNRDFVAMEIIDGESLADWLRAEPRGEREILDAYVAAGRGLAAAHAAGIVHRDFKPHNVLRGRTGRIVVTDFGLARDATDPLATTLPAVPTAATVSSASDLVTVPGSVLGTPAYMAPEQWSGGRLTAATDQFAFCVALWEALAGERPYRGATAESLREQVTRGPAELDASKLPRRLRTVLLRGLSPAPDRRWPSMDALLARLAPRSRGTIAIAGVAVLVAGGILIAVTRTPAETCRSPALDPARIDPSLPSDTWATHRASACRLPGEARGQRLDCLDRVLARDVAIARIRSRPPAESIARALAVDPAVCERASPALPASYSDEAVAALAIYAGAQIDPSRVDRARKSTEPCVVAYLALSDNREVSPGCADDALRAELELRGFEQDAIGLADADLVARGREVLRVLETAGRGVMAWRIEAAKGRALHARRRFAEALASFETALTEAPDREAPDLVLRQLVTLIERAHPGDLVRIRKDAAHGHAIASRHGLHVTAGRIVQIDATAQWLQGDLAGAHPRLASLDRRVPLAMMSTRQIRGVVVTAAGTPVAGAKVAAGLVVVGDGHELATPLYSTGDVLSLFDVATTDASGAYTIEHAPPCLGTLIAQHGALRSRPIDVVDGARLVLEPTTRVRGRVELGGRVGSFIVAIAPQTTQLGAASIAAPVAADGRFEIAGVVAGPATIGVTESATSYLGHTIARKIVVDPKRPIDDLALELPAGRVVRVLLRDTTFADAPVFFLAGKFEGMAMHHLIEHARIGESATADAQVISGKPAPEIAASYRPGDLLATFPSAPVGPATLCTVQRFDGCQFANTPIYCQPVAANAALVVVDGGVTQVK